MVEPMKAAVKVARIFERLGIPYVLGGSLASSIRGEPRTTMDVDFAVHLDRSHVGRLVEACQGKFLVQEQSIHEALRAPGIFNIIHLPDYVKVDVHVVQRSGLDQKQIERGRWSRISRDSEDELLVATAEDIVLQKLIWYGKTDAQSDRQWRDVMGVLKQRRGALDLGYLKHWSTETGTAELLERALKESGALAPPDPGPPR